MSTEKKYTQKDVDEMKNMVNLVFRAELAISEEWQPKIKDMLQLSEDERNKRADEYMTAIATEILNHCI